MKQPYPANWEQLPHHRCGVCGQPGHNRRTCGKNPTVAPNPNRDSTRDSIIPTPAGPTPHPSPSVSSTYTRFTGLTHQAGEKNEEEGKDSGKGRSDSDASALTVDDVETWWQLAKPATTPDDWIEKETDTELFVDFLNRNIPDNQLVYDVFAAQTQELRETAANLNTTPERILTILARDDHHVVRLLVASNSRTPTQVLHILLEDQSSWVRDTAKDHLDTLAHPDVSWDTGKPAPPI